MTIEPGQQPDASEAVRDGLRAFCLAWRDRQSAGAARELVSGNAVDEVVRLVEVLLAECGQPAAALPIFDSEPRKFLTAWVEAGQPDTIATAGGHALTVPQLHELLADRAQMAAELEQMRGNAYAEAVEKYAADMADQARIKSMEIRGGTFHLELDDAREMTAALVATARTMLGDAENYSETRVDFPAGKVEWEVKLAGELDRYVFTVQRAGKLTPHEARMRAEAERDEARAELERLRGEREADAGRVEYATGILSDLTDPDPCWFDHHGGCQAHGFLSLEDGEQCPHALAKAFLAGAEDHRHTKLTDQPDPQSYTSPGRRTRLEPERAQEPDPTTTERPSAGRTTPPTRSTP